MLDKVSRLAAADLPEVLWLARAHSPAGVAAILSEKMGLITELDVVQFLRNCKQN